MGRFHHSEKAHSEGKGKKNNKKFARKQEIRRQLCLYVLKKHKNIWNSFCNFLDERFAEEDLSWILDAEEIARSKIPPTIPALLEFIPANVGDLESDEARIRAQRQILREQGSLSSGWTQETKTEV